MWNPGGISEEWLKAHSSKAPEILEEIESGTLQLFSSGAHMLSGFAQGRLLALFSEMLMPQRILEIGTFTGYGSICLAEGLCPEGILITIEKNHEYADVAENWFQKSKYHDNIRLLRGNAAEMLDALHETWDLVYIDADKAANRNYLRLVWPNVRKGGLVIIDNVFARGGILKPEAEQRPFEKEITKLNQELPQLFPDSNLVILPIRDGLSILRKTN